MDLLTKEAILPLADEAFPGGSAKTSQAMIAAARSLPGQPVVWGGASLAQGLTAQVWYNMFSARPV